MKKPRAGMAQKEFELLPVGTEVVLLSDYDGAELDRGTVEMFCGLNFIHWKVADTAEMPIRELVKRIEVIS